MSNQGLHSATRVSGANSSDAARLALQVDRDDPMRLRLALARAASICEAARAAGRHAAVEIVAHGDGAALLQEGSAGAEAMRRTLARFPQIKVSVCGMWRDLLKARGAGHAKVLPGVREVRSGIVRLIELEMDGWRRIDA